MKSTIALLSLLVCSTLLAKEPKFRQQDIDVGVGVGYGLQIALASGTLIGLALALLVWRLAPSDPDLVDALNRLSPDHVVPRRGAHDLPQRRQPRRLVPQYRNQRVGQNGPALLPGVE